MPYKITSVSKGVDALCDVERPTSYYNTLFETTDCTVVWIDPLTPEEVAATSAANGCKECCHACEQYMADKISSGFVYGGNTYQINGSAQEAIGKRAIYAGWSVQDPVTFPWGDPYSLGWWDIFNIWHAMTAAEFRLFAKSVSDYVSACASCCRTHKSAITTLNYSTYDYTTGWPVNP